MRGIVESPPIITNVADIELMVNNFYRCLKLPYPESVLAFAPLIFVDPRQLPTDVLAKFPEHFNYLAEILVSRSPDGLMLNKVLQDKYLPVKAAPEEVLYWMGSVRISHGIYSDTPMEILFGIAHQIRSLIDAGAYPGADARIEHLYRMQAETGSEPVDIKALVTLLEQQKAAHPAPSANWEEGLAEDMMEYSEETHDIPAAQPAQPTTPAKKSNVLKYFGNVLLNDRLTLSASGVTTADFLDDFTDATTAELAEWLPLMIQVVRNELRLNQPASIRFIGELDSGMHERLFRNDNAEKHNQYDEALKEWYSLLSTAPVGLYELLSTRTSYYALQQFATLDFNPRHDKIDALRRFDLLRTYAGMMQDYKTSLGAANKKIRWAQLSRDNATALAAAQDAYRYSRTLLAQNRPEVSAQAIWSTRSYSQLSSWFNDEVQAANLLLDIPTDFKFSTLDVKAQVNYILSRIELATLFQEAGQEQSRVQLLNEAAHLYESIGYVNDATKLRAQHRL